MLHPAFTLPPSTHTRPRPNVGRLAGWQIPVKDGTDVAGMTTTHGSPARAYTATATDPFISNLLTQGVAIHGKTLTSELGATCYAERPDVPVLESPAYPGCTPGGSSTGAAVVVADGTVRAAHGTDAGGSIRVPAAACEIVGFKPASKGIAAHGFLTQDVADQFTLWGWHRRIKGKQLRIGVLTDGIFARPDVEDRRGALVEKLASALDFEVVQLKPYRESLETYAHFTTTITASFNLTDPLDSEYIGWLVEQSHELTNSDLDAAEQHRRDLPHLIASQWDVDVVLSPTLAFAPPRIGYFPSLTPEASFHAQTEWSPWCSLYNMLGTPAIALGGVHLGSLTLTGPELLTVAQHIETLLGD